MMDRRRGLLFNKARLPKEYQEVEWIGSSGTQYINTEIYSYTNMAVECIFSYMKYYSGTGNRQIFGAYKSNTNYCRCGLKYVNTTFDVDSFIDAIYTPPDFLVGQITRLVGTAKYNTTLKIYLFSQNESDRAVASTAANIYYVKFGQEREFIPCYRKLDSVIGMYDLVSKTFFTNAGTGTFTKGPDVN